MSAELNTDLRLETISDERAFAALGERWDELVRVMPRPSPFILHGWLYEWWRHYGDKGRLHVETAWRGERLVAAIPLFVSRRRGVRTAEYMGGHGSALADLLIAPDEDHAVARELGRRAAAAGWDRADLFGLPGNNWLARALPAGCCA